jgi:hypothetical protein
MDTAKNLTDFMRRLQKHGIKGQLGNIKAATTTEVNWHLTNDLVTQNCIDTKTKMKSKLLNLPGEIRQLIWRNLLISSTGFVKPIWGGDNGETNDTPMIEVHYHAVQNDFYNHPEERIHLSILFTSRVLYHECANMFWGANTFLFNPLRPAGFLHTLDHSKEDWLSTSICHKIKHVQFNFNLSSNEVLVFTDERSHMEGIIWILAALEKMADSEQGSLKSLTVKPLDSLLDLEIALDKLYSGRAFVRRLRTIWGIFDDLNERGKVAGVKRKVEVELLWNGKTHEEQERFRLHYGEQKDTPDDQQPLQATSLLSTVAQYMGGINGQMWVDGKLCFENVEGNVKRSTDPFPMKKLEKEETEQFEL